MKKRAAKILVTLIATVIIFLVFLSVTSGLIQQWLLDAADRIPECFLAVAVR
jgi:hypothetical protein